MFNLAPTPTRGRAAIFARIFALGLLAAAYVALPPSVRADTTVTYDIAGTLNSGTFSGTIEFDQSSSTLQLINSSLTVDGSSFACTGASSNTCAVYDPFGVSYVTIPGQGQLVLLNWLDSSFNISNPPPSFNLLGGYCLNCGSGGYDYIISGQATAVATPEPSSWMLLGAGILGLALLSLRGRILPSAIA
jgi:hypothetical protein